MSEFVDFSHRTKLRKIRFKKHRFVKKVFTLKSNAWDIKNHNPVNDLENLLGLIGRVPLIVSNPKAIMSISIC